MFNSYTANPQRPMIDVGDTIDRLTQGASSLIAQAYELKRAKAADQLRQAEFGLAQQREQRESAREARETANADRDFDLRQTTERHRFIEAGGLPSSTTVDAVPAGRATITPLQNEPSPIERAMGGGLPPLRVTPSAATSVTEIGGTAPVNATEVVTTPESFDATRSSAYQRGIDAATIRENALTARDAGRNEARAAQAAAHDARVAAMRESAATSAAGLARLRATLQRGNSNIAKAMSGTQMERGRVAAAEDLIDKAGGSYDDAVDMLEHSDQGKILRQQGVTPFHLSQAHSAYVNRTTGQATKMQTGTFGVSPDTSVARVQGTRKKLGAQPDSSAAQAPAKAIIPPGTKPPTTPPAAADDFNDEEIAAAMRAGKTTPDEVTKYITAQRKKKKGGS